MRALKHMVQRESRIEVECTGWLVPKVCDGKRIGCGRTDGDGVEGSCDDEVVVEAQMIGDQAHQGVADSPRHSEPQSVLAVLITSLLTQQIQSVAVEHAAAHTEEAHRHHDTQDIFKPHFMIPKPPWKRKGHQQSR